MHKLQNAEAEWNKVEYSHACREVVIPQRLMASLEAYQEGGIIAPTQLLVHMHLTTKGGHVNVVKALIDTGAEVNIIKRGIFEPLCFQPARKRLSLVTADGTVMEGGKQEVQVEIRLRLDQGGRSHWQATTFFYEADIGVDAIIGYPWLAANRLSVLSHAHCLEWTNNKGRRFRIRDYAPLRAVRTVSENKIEEESVPEMEMWVDQ